MRAVKRYCVAKHSTLTVVSDKIEFSLCTRSLPPLFSAARAIWAPDLPICWALPAFHLVSLQRTVRDEFVWFAIW